MTLKQTIDQNLKQAMLAGEKELVTTLRGLKSVILYAEVAKGSRDAGLSDDEIIQLFSKEAKKRQESADLFAQGGNQEQQENELREKRIIEAYLPEQISEEELSALVDAVIKELDAHGPQAMGSVIGAVKAKTGASADGSLIAKLTKEKLSTQ